MKFTVSQYAPSFEQREPNSVVLTIDNWNDFGFYCLFGIQYIDEHKDMYDLGGIRIAFYGQQSGQRINLASTFTDQIGGQYFSVGTSEEYYEKLNSLGQEIRDKVLYGLNDIAKNSDTFEKVIEEEAFLVSFLRGLEISTIIGQFRRIASGGIIQASYKFTYMREQNEHFDSLKLDFEVLPDSNPPTNIHVVIGKNGVGKTLLTERIVGAFYKEFPEHNGYFTNIDSHGELANLMLVSFSVFDEKDHSLRESYGNYYYIGLLKKGTVNQLKSQEDLGDDFYNSIMGCVSRKLETRLSSALSIFKRDGNLNLFDLVELIENPFHVALETKIKERFRQLSSGHKIALLTITRLVENLQDRSLLIMDEPEAHLHPPLLSALIRTISSLLIRTNGVAIIATHSPVVLQEVPKSCVFKLSRSGDIMKAERPRIETFGENVGTLTNDVFGLEVMDSGFYMMLVQILEESNCNYDEVIERFGNNIGMEARAIIMAHIANKKDF